MWMTVSDRARRLIEALHEPFDLADRWEIAQAFLDEEREQLKNPGEVLPVVQYVTPPATCPSCYEPMHDDGHGKSHCPKCGYGICCSDSV